MALLKNIAEFKKIIPVTVASTIEPLESDIALAEETFLIPQIGYSAYNELQAKYDVNDLDADFKTLLNKCQRTIAYNAWLLYIPKAQLIFGDEGIRIASNEHFKTAFNWQIDDLEDACRNAGDVTMELLLAYMESKSTVFTTWAGSDAFTHLKDRFVYSTDIFNRSVVRKIYRRVFRKLSVQLRNAELWYIKPTVGSGLYDELHTQHSAGTLSANNVKLMEYIELATANLAFASGFASLAIDVNDLGITEGYNADTKQKNLKPAAKESRSDMVSALQTEGEKHVRDLSQFLYDNHADYPLFEASTAYNVEPYTKFNNTIDKKHYVV